MTERRWYALALVAAFMTSGGVAAQQVVTLDEGSFRLLEGGREIGTETFSIGQRQAGDGETIIARGRVTPGPSGTGEMELSVQTSGAALWPAGYVIQVSGGDRRTISGQLEGRRMRATIESSAGQNVREYLVSEGAVLAEPRVAHQHYFVVARATEAGARVPIIVPSESRQMFATVTLGETEPLRVGDRTIEARKVTVQPEGAAERIVWIDANRRVLRLEVPARNFVAERTAPPA